MKQYKPIIIVIGLLFPILLFAFTVPAKPTGFVQDYAHILSVDQVTSLESKIEAYEKQSTNEIAVVTVSSLDGEPIENLAQEIFTQWGIGKKGKDNGVLLLVSLSDRKTRIHTGYGVEGDLTDIGTSYIQSDIITPAFRAGDYNVGLTGAVDAMITALGGADIVPDNYSQSSQGSHINWQVVFFFGFFFFQIIISVLARSKSWWGGGVLGGVIGGIIWYAGLLSIAFSVGVFILFIVLGLLLDFLVSRAYARGGLRGRGPGGIFWGGGGFGGGSGGGGFGGFGGGGSGGGGSSGGW